MSALRGRFIIGSWTKNDLAICRNRLGKSIFVTMNGTPSDGTSGDYGWIQNPT
jgi:hypothetical protein